MESEDLLIFADDPNQIKENDLEVLEDIVADYPFFNTAHLLIAKATQKHNKILAPQKIRKAAAYTNDRNWLRYFMDANYESIYSARISKKEDWDEDLLEEKEKTNFENPYIESTILKSQKRFIEKDFSHIDKEELSDYLAIEYYNKGKIEEAVYVYEKLIDLNPSQREYYVNQVRILTDDDEYNYTPQSKVAVQTPIIDHEEVKVEAVQGTTHLSELETKKLEERTEYVKLESITLEPKVESKPILEIVEPKIEYQTDQKQIEEIEDQNSPLLEPKPIIEEDKEPFQINEQLLQDFKKKITPAQKEAEEETTQLQPAIPNFKTVFEQATIKVDKLDLEDDRLSETLALSYTSKRQYGDALMVYKRLIEKYPDRENYYLIQINSLEQELKLEETQKESVASNDSPIPAQDANSQLRFQDEIPVSESYAVSLLSQNRPKEAVAIYHKLIAEFPERQSYFQDKIRLVEQNNKPKEEQPVSFFDTISLEEPGITFTPTPDSKTAVEIDERLAMNYFQEGNMKSAIEVYHKLMQLNPLKKEYYQQQINTMEGNFPSEDSIDSKMEENKTFAANTAVIHDYEDTTPTIEPVATIAEHMTESNALSLFNTGKVKEAIEIYEQLKLQFPERSTYFASQIDVLKS
jgi:tetratricopeptide (TPR) repeat protein